MRRFAPKSRILVAAALAVAIAASAARAGPGEPAGKAWTGSDLKPVLDGLGHETKELGKGAWQVFVKLPDGLKYFLVVSLSPDAGHVRLEVPLAEVPPLETAFAGPLKALLADNAAPAPAHFEVAGTSLRLSRWLDNRGLSPALLEREMTTLAQFVRQEERRWDVSSWNPRSPAQQPLVPGGEGGK